MVINLETAVEFLKTRDNFLILTHSHPDGDTLGSAFALKYALEAVGKRANVKCNDTVAKKFDYLGKVCEDECAFDALVAVDVADTKLLGKDFEEKFADRIELCIDHHGSNRMFAERTLLDANAAAACEIVLEVIHALGIKPTKQIADCIYTGISTDTGCFRFSNTTAHTFSVAALCTRAGARIYELNQELFETNTLERLKMQAWIVEHLELLRGGEMAICAIPRVVEEEIGVNEDDMDNISNFPRTVAGVRMAATLRETEDGETKLSVRAVPGCDATVVAVRFGGGGHKGAAGASMKLSLHEAVKAVETVMLEVK